jgi:uncharacterized protein YjbJ (UPF0337 family)
MNTQSLKGAWEQMKGTLKEKYAKLTDDDLKLAEGKEEEMYGNLQKKLGITRDVLDKIIHEHHELALEKAKKAGHSDHSAPHKK